MKYAKSIYYGGTIISAWECDYNTSRKLGLSCPICSEAVFLKARNSQTLTPHFSHYKFANNILDCENRIKTPAGKKAIEGIELEAKKQRLSIYNKYLWLLILKDCQFKKSSLLSLRKFMGQKRIEFYSKEFRKEWRENYRDFYKDMKKLVDVAAKGGRIHYDSLMQKGIEEQEKYFQTKCDLRLHLLICQEICQYLSSQTAKGIWLKLTVLALALRLSIAYRRNEPQPEIKNSECLQLISGVISGIHWVDLIYGNQDKNSAVFIENSDHTDRCRDTDVGLLFFEDKSYTG
ncbi:MAG: hypothetical protein QNJ54_16220 [Prochloraceae cyanobacterium]|nr:hypothetical protein [Prochloraceae cyanobacterium]